MPEERFWEHARSARRLKQASPEVGMTMAARANWKGVLKIGEVSCPVALYTAASTAGRIAFHILNRKTGHRVHREFVDAETGKAVEAKEQVKGYETGTGDYIPFEPEEIEKAVPEADKTLDVEAFVPCDQVDDCLFRPALLPHAGHARRG
jgi:DNA end-binding protein Ku